MAEICYTERSQISEFWLQNEMEDSLCVNFNMIGKQLSNHKVATQRIFHFIRIILFSRSTLWTERKFNSLARRTRRHVSIIQQQVSSVAALLVFLLHYLAVFGELLLQHISRSGSESMEPVIQFSPLDGNLQH